MFERDMCTNSLPKIKCINRDFIVKKAALDYSAGVSDCLLLVSAVSLSSLHMIWGISEHLRTFSSFFSLFLQ